MKSNESSIFVPLPFMIRTLAEIVETPFVCALKGPPVAPTEGESVKAGVLAKAVVNVMTYRPVAVREAVKPEPNDTAPDELMRPRRMRSFSSPLAAWYWPEERG